MQRRRFIRQGATAGGLVLSAGSVPAQQDATRASGIRIILTSVIVDDQAKALKFYTEVLGFVKKADFPVGAARWLTVVDGSSQVELLLEPDGHPAGRTFQKALFNDGVALTMFGAADVQKEFERLTSLGVKFRTKPTKRGPATIAVFEDTCGNLIQIAEK